MATVISTSSAANCRRAAVPACDPSVEMPAGGNPPSVDGSTILVKAGDIIDVGLDWSQWCAANDGKIATSAWAAHGSSPQAPTLGDDGIDQAKQQTVAIVDASAASVGDIYYLQNTVTVSDATPGQANSYDLPTRTLKRVIHVRVVL